MQSWYALQTKPRQEPHAAVQLQLRNLPVYLPLVRVKTVNPRAARLRPFFPGYLFARLDTAAIVPPQLRWVPGLRGVVQFGGQPAIVPDPVIHELKQRIDSIVSAGGLDGEGFRPGEPVLITHGPFAGYEAIFDLRLRDSTRARVLLEMLHRVVPVQISTDHIRRVAGVR